MKKFILFLLFLSLLFNVACEENDPFLEPDYSLIKRAKDTDILLRSNLWSFNDLMIEVKYEMRAIPLLANVADDNGMVQPGQYNSFEIFGNNRRQNKYTYQFTAAGVYLDTASQDAYQRMASYNILNSTDIRLNLDSIGAIDYSYKYLEDGELFTMTSDYLANGKINQSVNKIIADAILSGKPDDIANAFVDKILANEEIQLSIQQALYDLIHGKIEEITQNPEEISQKLAEIILDKLKEVDWENLVYEKVLALLEELKVDDPEMVAQEIAAKISDKIETSISQTDIYEAILPIFVRFEDEALPKLVPVVADAIYGVIVNAFSVENIYDKFYPVWISFSEVDSTAISSVADSLGSVISSYFFNVDSLADSLEPFINTLRTTSTTKIPALAQEIIDDKLIPLVDSLNSTFPGLELEPDWASIKPVLTSALSLIKSSIGDQTDEEAALSLAESIIGIMDLVISQAIESAIFHFQDIPADQASTVFATWVNNLVIMAEPQVVAFLEGKLTELTDLFHAEEIAEALSTEIYNTLLGIFSSDNIYNLIIPVIERFNEINIDEAAAKIADWLFDLELIKDNVSEEQVLDAIANMVGELIGSVNVDEVSQKLTDLILESEIVGNIDGSVLKQLIETKTYELLIELGKDINAIEKIEFSIVRNPL